MKESITFLADKEDKDATSQQIALIQATIELAEWMKKDSGGGDTRNLPFPCPWCGVGELQIHKGDCRVLQANIHNAALIQLIQSLQQSLKEINSV